MGDELYTVVDFGPGWFDPSSAFAAQAAMNAPGKSPPFCSEFYTGWLTHWGEAMANTSSEVLFKDTQVLLEWANSTASLSFYMIHGGTNFGFWAGANVDGERYLPHITSYDYDAPISGGSALARMVFLGVMLMAVNGLAKVLLMHKACPETPACTPPPCLPPPTEAGDYCQPGIGGDCKYYVSWDACKHLASAVLCRAPVVSGVAAGVKWQASNQCYITAA
jgi:beta-galactosidase